MRASEKLTAIQVQKMTEPGRYADGNGLYLQVAPGGSKQWLLRYMRDNVARHMGLGSVSTFSLKEARERARRERQKLADGIDPIEARLKEREAKRADAAARIIFKEAAKRFIALHEKDWKNQKHRSQWKNTLEEYAYPKLGPRPVSAIDAALINDTLAPIWDVKPETASRVKQRIERVVQWVKDGMPLPKASASKRVKHHKALPWQELPTFMQRLRVLTSISARALEFTILTAARTSATIGATWEEIDLEAKVWTVPAERTGTKLKKDHRVPLSDRAIEVLKSLPRERGNKHVFIGAAAGGGLSDMAMLECLRGMNGDGLTVHGFRSAFKDWTSETTGYANIVSEMALAHTISDKVEAAYRRGDLFEKRRKLMQAWAGYCARKAGSGDVVAIRKAKAS